MLRTVLAVLAMGTAVAIFSCSGGNLTGGNGGGHGGTGGGPRDAASDACTGTFVPASCYRACDGTSATPIGNGCPAGYAYSAAVCYPGYVGIDGAGPVTNTCGDDGGTDARDAAADACQGTFIPATCWRACDYSHAVPVGETCPADYIYVAAVCYSFPVAGPDGGGPITTCGDGGTDAGDGGPIDAPADACTGTLIPAWCFDNNDGCWAIPDGGSCAAGSTYYAENCFHGGVDGRGPICSTGGTGGGGGNGGRGGAGAP